METADHHTWASSLDVCEGIDEVFRTRAEAVIAAGAVATVLHLTPEGWRDEWTGKIVLPPDTPQP